MSEEVRSRSRSGSLYRTGTAYSSQIRGEIRGKLHAETIVVGGGVIGCAIAYELASQGKEVILVERSRIAGGTSCAAAGMLASDSEEFHSPVLTKLAHESKALLHQQTEHISALSGIDIGLQQHGFITPFRQENEMNNYRDKRSGDLTTEHVWWDRSILQHRAPWISEEAHGALYRPSESEVLPVNLARAYARAAQTLGAKVIEGVQNVRLNVDANRVQGVDTSIGMMTCKHVIIAAGLQGGELIKQAGLNLPVLPVKGEIAAVRFADHDTGYRPDKTVYADNVYIVPKANGEVWIGATSLPGRSDHIVTVKGIQQLLASAASWVPGIGQAQYLRAWAGVRPSTPDGLPYIGACESIPGLYTAFGHYRNGILLSAITGRLMANLIGGHTSEELGIEELCPERLSRKEIMQ
ncbi:glycine oxidase ThiO [Paenibacillus xylanilyticus]|uniref:glycine oxidase n=1 Tax=Paenibacillus xylanilyticus TaxID=248903 RepID=A0A7Y6EY23_9BACL|nr:glycine oxidase ThiO [Paenibacillus xylanilyticus]NUU79466.1 glycine oxidase ThiO [Paenibacillus xylanilyticus]